MAKKQKSKNKQPKSTEMPLSFFTCPNPDCSDFNRFDAGNLSVAERMGKSKAIRRLYCKTCGTRFSERKGSLMQYTKLPVSAWESIARFFGIGSLPDSPLLVYAGRLMSATSVAVGVFFVILALHPMKYGVMVPFSGLAAVFVGVVCGISRPVSSNGHFVVPR